MNNNELMEENALLRVQVEQLQQQLESNQSPDWIALIGCWNRQASNLLIEWSQEANAIHSIRMKNGTEPSDDQKRRFKILSQLIKYSDKIHAICEARQQQRNASLGLPPTEWQLCQMLGLATTPSLPDRGRSQRDISREAQTFAPPAGVQQHQKAR